MGAIISDDVTVRSLLWDSGYDCPEELMDATWGDLLRLKRISLEENKAVDIFENGSHVVLPTGKKGAMEKVTFTANVHSVLYAWERAQGFLVYTLHRTPKKNSVCIGGSLSSIERRVIESVLDDERIVVDGEEYIRKESEDIVLWAEN